MNRAIHVTLGLFLAIFLVAIAGQTAEALTADDIFKKASAQYGLFTSAFKDMTIEREMTLTQGNVKVLTTIMRKGNKYRIETKGGIPGGAAGAQMPDMKTVVVFDGKETWMTNPMTGKKKLTGAEAKEKSPEGHWTDSLKGRLSLLGKEMVGDRNAWVFDVKQDDNSKEQSALSKLWVDTKNYWMLKAITKTAGTVMESQMSDFRKVKGDYSMPFKQKIFADGVLQATSLIKSIKTNTGLSDDLFDASKLESKGAGVGDILKWGLQGN